MFCYKEVKEWHNKGGLETQSESVDWTFDRSYVRTKLENGLLRVWRVCLIDIHCRVE